MPNPRGFGLVQRDRDFDHYQDLETRAETRPSAWVAPKGDWGDGRVELVEIPTKTDTNDNIVAYWVPEQPPQPASRSRFAYIVYWYGDDATRPPGGRVVATRRDRGTDGGRVPLRRSTSRAASSKALPAETGRCAASSPSARAATSGELLDQHVVKNPSPAAGG